MGYFQKIKFKFLKSIVISGLLQAYHMFLYEIRNNEISTLNPTPFVAINVFTPRPAVKIS